MDLCIKTYILRSDLYCSDGFNPCFNGSMYKNIFYIVGIAGAVASFNPCFNGSMYKNKSEDKKSPLTFKVSILVLMDLCIKT